MLVELSKAQDIEAGDGTTSVVVLAGSLLEAASRLLEKGDVIEIAHINLKGWLVGYVHDVTFLPPPDKVEFSLSIHFSGLHPTTISDAFQEAATKCCEILLEMATPVDLGDRQSLLQSASTSLNSKVVSQHSSLLAPMAVDAVLEVRYALFAHFTFALFGVPSAPIFALFLPKRSVV